MSIGSRLREIASQIASEQETRASDLKREILDLKAATAQKEAELKAADLASERLTNFPVDRGSNFYCPRCWVRDEKRSPLTPIGGTDAMGCDALR